MIIELFGAPGAGKTTFATALAAWLRESGHTVELVLSYRPAESALSQGGAGQPSFGQSLADGLRRMGRPVTEMVSSVSLLRGPSEATEIIVTLLRLLPPRNLLWSIRLRQYMLRLFEAWNRASSANHIMLFDQGFIQAVCSFVLLSRASDQALIRHALEVVPKPDRSILLVAPPDILRARLEERYRLQGRFEQMLELTIDENLRSIAIIDELFGLLRREGHYVSYVNSSDPQSTALAAERFVLDLVQTGEPTAQ
ncbi:MAG: AAA family ATPase [Rhodopila sp.]|nr:AAA family ATPase [Rhodopila sp.]